MSRQVWLWSVGIGMLALGGVVLLADRGGAGEPNKYKASVLKIADAFKKGDKAGAEKEAAALAKKVDSLDELMELFKKRDKNGLGVGPKPGVVTPDGIEIKLVTMGRDAPTATALKKEAEALEEMGYAIAAMGAITKHKAPTKGKAKHWMDLCDEMVTSGLKLSAGAKAKSSGDLKTAASKVNNSCNSCHSEYRK
jgi:hypothetical protein